MGDEFIKKNFPSGVYVSSHVRRNDFLRFKKVPPLSYVAKRIGFLMDKYNTNKAFVCTDATSAEKDELRSFVDPRKEIVFYEEKQDHPGVVAAIDQWIAMRGVYFVGSSGSRYSTVIRWERLLMGYSRKMTGDTLCDPDENGESLPVSEPCLSNPVHDPPEFVSRSHLRREYMPRAIGM
eukprot:GHVS01058352.1.p1 GENE.GHVS01058352.1~~GHVS01058352.1.p1  ORF type:complete len:179 (-),score=3.69 GHVS01058352.1:282-818(-)